MDVEWTSTKTDWRWPLSAAISTLWPSSPTPERDSDRVGLSSVRSASPGCSHGRRRPHRAEGAGVHQVGQHPPVRSSPKA